MKLDKDQKRKLQDWSLVCKSVYNSAIEYLNTYQGFDQLGQAKGTKEMQFQTLAMKSLFSNYKK